MGESYGQKVRRLRKERGWTQQDLAAESGVPRRTIQDVEVDKHGRPQRATLLALNAALDIEGNPEEERAGWTTDVQVILDIVGAYLMTLTPEERIKWMSEITPTIIHGR